MSKLSGLALWYLDQYRRAVGLPEVEGDAKFKKFIKGFPAPSADPASVTYPITGNIRIRMFLDLRLNYPLGDQGYTCAALEVALGGRRAHFGYAYWRRGEEADTPEYLCLSPCYESRDGEYRSRVMRGAFFLGAYEKLAADLAVYENVVLSLMGERGFELTSTVYPGGAGPAALGRLPVMAFAAALALDGWRAKLHTMMVHTNRTYISIIDEINNRYPELTKEEHYEKHDYYSLFRRGGYYKASTVCGQKIVPMFVRETMQVADYNFGTWRELEITKLVSDLVINFIAPGFAMYNQWTYIENADRGLFDNEAMALRYRRGAVADAATASVREARRTVGSLDADKNYYSEELSGKLYESIEYAQSFLSVSSIAILHTMEHVGMTIASVSGYARRMPGGFVFNDNALAVLKDFSHGARLLFDYVYSAHCLHSKLGVAHTDLHGNNMTLYRWGLGDSPSTPYEDPVVAYALGPRGAADTYVFPAAGVSGCIIDYSRAILGPAFRSRLEEGRTPQYATNFYRDQVNRVMRTLHRYAPDFVARNQDRLKAAVLANFEAVFPVLCAVDFIAIGTQVRAALEAAAKAEDEHATRKIEINPAILEFATEIANVGRELFIVGLHDLAETAGARQRLKAPAWPGAALIPRVFARWRYGDGRGQLVDAYRYENELRYSGREYAQFPPWAQLDQIEPHLGEYTLTQVFERGFEPLFESLRPVVRAEVIADQLRARESDGKPAAAMSSWIDE